MWNLFFVKIYQLYLLILQKKSNNTQTNRINRETNLFFTFLLHCEKNFHFEILTKSLQSNFSNTQLISNSWPVQAHNIANVKAGIYLRGLNWTLKVRIEITIFSLDEIWKYNIRRNKKPKRKIEDFKGWGR